MKGYIHLFVNNHFVNHYRDGLDMDIKDFIVNESISIKGVNYIVKKVESLVVGPRAMPITYVYVEE